ncbi:MAG TPA: hypothetical protein VGP76_01015 [Planctomycetaceae bacterium]|jgi:hypothetical protein|nr:hypothetical protein [Planctomycetaceae bacterium]
MSDEPAQFIVRATGVHDTFWLSKPCVKGIRTIGAREHADVFSTALEASDAIDKMPQAFTRAGVRFSIELASA